MRKTKAQKEDEEIKRLREVSLKLKEERSKHRDYLMPKKLRFPLLWTIFFVIVGLIQRSIIEKKIAIAEFFTSNYVNWFSKFGNFIMQYSYIDRKEIIYSILSEWYYFFITGGLLSILWAILYLMINIKVKRENHFDFSN